MDGFINVLKPPGMSSHDVVGFVRKLLRIKKVGHAGTLDPGAAGVLPVAVGRATRFIEYLSAASKSYRAELLFGISTDSGDDTGRITEQQDDFLLPDDQMITEALKHFTGTIFQVPPAYSAIKIQGQKACDLARKNIKVTIPQRQVTISRFDMIARRKDTLLLDIDCSKGTYIRTLCTDLGKYLTLPATMSFLVRTRVGDFLLAEAYTLEELTTVGAAAVLPPDQYMSHLPAYTLQPNRAMAFKNGLETHDTAFQGTAGLLRVYAQGKFMGIGRYDAAQQNVFPEKVFLN